MGLVPCGLERIAFPPFPFLTHNRAFQLYNYHIHCHNMVIKTAKLNDIGMNGSMDR